MCEWKNSDLVSPKLDSSDQHTDSGIYLYTTRYCPFCIKAKQLLASKGVEFCEIAVDDNPQLRIEMMQRSGRRTVPQIWIGQQHVGGCDDLWVLERDGVLDSMIQAATIRTNLRI